MSCGLRAVASTILMPRWCKPSSDIATAAWTRCELSKSVPSTSMAINRIGAWAFFKMDTELGGKAHDCLFRGILTRKLGDYSSRFHYQDAIAATEHFRQF